MNNDKQQPSVPGLPPSERQAIEEAAKGDQKDSGAEEAKFLNRGLSSDELRREAEKNDHKRNENFLNHFEFIAIGGLWIAAFSFLIVGVTWLYHLLTPECWHWLDADHLAKLQNIVTGGVLTSVAAGHLKKRLKS